MQGYFWYLALVVISIMIMVITYWKSNNKLIFAMLFGVAGLCYQIETIILIWLKAYVYYPGFIPDKLADSILGASVSNLFCLPSTTVLIAVFQLNWGWIITISAWTNPHLYNPACHIELFEDPLRIFNIYDSKKRQVYHQMDGSFRGA
jgi:hypothetical protein